MLLRHVRSLLWPIVLVVLLGLGLFALLEALLAGALGGAAGPVAALLATAVVAAVLYWIVLRRINRLNRALSEVAAGDLESRLHSRARDEIGELTESINAMITKLRSNYDELRTNDELRRRLVANVSHELRTPLTSVQGYLETAKLAGPDSPDLASNLEICHRETRRLGRLVQDLFELSKLDTQQLEFRFEVVSLVEIADQVGLAFEQRMRDKQIEFVVELPDDPLEVHADGNRLSQVLSNLLGNASVFTPPGGQVTLRCEPQDGRAVCSVIDTGIGISKKDLPRIFESFFHLEKSRTRNLGGTGLGLAICKAIIDYHGGTIEARSAVGEGTTFTFELQLAEPVPED